jgi:hypothetical protein
MKMNNEQLLSQIEDVIEQLTREMDKGGGVDRQAWRDILLEFVAKLRDVDPL